MNVFLTSTPVIGRARRLATRWAEEKDQTLDAYCGQDSVAGILWKKGPGMNQVRVTKINLLDIIKRNRDEHRGLFIEAQERYREVAIKVLDEKLAAARDGRPFVLHELTELEAPVDHTEDYDRAIGMLEMSVDDTITVSQEEYRCFVEDRWRWSRDWALSNLKYCSQANTNSRSYSKLSSMAS